LLNFVFVAILTSQYWACSKGDHQSSCIRDWRTSKEKIACKVKQEDPNFDGYCDPSMFYD